MISTAWQVVNVNNEIARKKLSNMQRMQEAKNALCVCNLCVCNAEEAKNALCVCNGEWQERERERERAIETLSNNNINIENFKPAIRQALQMGHRKRSNIMLIGPANCGKTFEFTN